MDSVIILVATGQCLYSFFSAVGEFDSVFAKIDCMSQSWSTTFDDFGSTSNNSQIRKRKYISRNIGDGESSHSTNFSAWVDRYSPLKFDELAVHKKKVAEVEAWISRTKIAKGAPILLMTGPSGCGKTATVLVTAAVRNTEVHEWTNPLSVPFSSIREAGLHYDSLSSLFEEFLFKSGRYPSLVLSDDSSRAKKENKNSTKILLVEDLPHHIIREPMDFRDTLRRYRRHQKYPLIIILSDQTVPDSTKRNLLPPDVCMQLKIQKISFNPISITAMSKALTRIAAKENQRLSKETLSQLVSLSSGDIRTAINSLQFLLQKGVPICVLPPERKKSKSCIKRQNSVDLMKADSTLSIGGKDVSLLLFRALGKILYCKREEPESRVAQLPSHLEHYYRDPLSFEPEKILEHCCLSGPSYSLFLQHNCPPFFSKLDDLLSALDYFCHADVIGTRRSAVDFSTDSTVALDAYEGSITARAVAFWNSDRATSKLCKSVAGQWRPLHKPAWYQVNRNRNENQALSHSLFWNFNLPSRELLLNLLPFVQKMTAERNNSLFAGKRAFELPLHAPQKDFLSRAVGLPNWKSFSSSERINEAETGELPTADIEMEDASYCPTADAEKLESVDNDPEEDFMIDDFDD